MSEYQWGKHFAEWLNLQLSEQNMSRSELVARMPLGHEGRPVVDQSSLTRWMSHGQRPTPVKVVAVADALDIPHAQALREAGYLEFPEEQEQPRIVAVSTVDELRAVRAFLRAWRDSRREPPERAPFGDATVGGGKPPSK